MTQKNLLDLLESLVAEMPKENLAHEFRHNGCRQFFLDITADQFATETKRTEVAELYGIKVIECAMVPFAQIWVADREGKILQRFIYPGASRYAGSEHKHLLLKI